MACLPMASFVPNFNVNLSLLTSSRRPLTMAASAISSSSRSGLLHCSFVGPASSISFSSNSAFSGASLGWELNSGFAAKPVKRQGLVVQASKFRLCQTKRNRSRKSLARTHGFRKRMSTTSGRAVIARRRAKGRWNLCPKSNPRSGKRA